MADLPKYDGKTPLTARAMNELARRSKANSRLAVCGGLGMYDLGSVGKVLTTTASGSATSSATATQSWTGFWARLYFSGDTTDPANAPPPPRPHKPYGYLVEQVLGTHGIGLSAQGVATADNPGGKKWFLEDFSYAFQHVASLNDPGGFGDDDAIANANVITLANWTSGSFRLTFGVGSASASTSSIAWPPTVASVRAAVDAMPALPGVTSWSVQQAAATGYVYQIYPVSAAPVSFTLAIDTSGLVGSGTTQSGFSLVYRPSQTKLLNANPHGQLVFCQPAIDGQGVTHYQFDLPYIGFWGRITGDRVDSTDPAAYPFQESRPAGAAQGLSVVPGGISGVAVEINGERSVNVGCYAWMTPLFSPGIGWTYLFQASSDVRILRYMGGDLPNAWVQAASSAAAYGLAAKQTWQPVMGQLTTNDQAPLQLGAYYVGYRDGTERGYPRYKVSGDLRTRAWPA